MKGNEKNVLIGMVIVAILLIAASYKFFYSASVEEAERVQAEINTRKTRLDELNAKNANRTQYESAIENSTAIIDTVLSIYGPGNSPEKSIMLIVDMCKKTGLSVYNISFEDNRLIYSSDTVDENGKPEIQIYGTGMALTASGGYTQFKKLHDFINSYPERMNLESFTMGFNGQTGLLDSAMYVNMYSVDDKNHVYVAPVIEEIELGTTNIFRTFEKPIEEEVTEEGEEGTEGNDVIVENTTNSETTE